MKNTKPMRKLYRNLGLTTLFLLMAAFFPMQSGGGMTAYAAGEFIIENGVLTGYTGSGGNVTIPSSVTSIGEWAFSDCTNLTGMTIPNSVTKIGYGAFYGCKNLKSVTIPTSVTKIDYWAFSGCSSLTSVSLPNSVAEIGNAAFFN